jgi:hypothetical protein
MVAQILIQGFVEYETGKSLYDFFLCYSRSKPPPFLTNCSGLSMTTWYMKFLPATIMISRSHFKTVSTALACGGRLPKTWVVGLGKLE